MITLFYCMGEGTKRYTQASINKMLELLSRFHDVHIKRRWLFQCLRDLEDDGYIRRRKRYLQRDGGLIAQIPSLWTFTFKGLKWLVSMGITKATVLAKKTLLWLQKRDGRFPKRDDFFGPEDPREDREAIERLKQLAEGVTKDIP